MNSTGSAYWLIYAFAFLFMCVIMYVIFGQILFNNLYPISQTINNVSVHNMNAPDRFLGFWKLTPFILLIVFIIFLFVKMGSTDNTPG